MMPYFSSELSFVENFTRAQVVKSMIQIRWEIEIKSFPERKHGHLKSPEKENKEQL
jgi:hypothetical protein